MKSFVLVLSLSFFVYRESVEMVAKEKKDLFVSLEKRQYEAEILPEAEKNQAERK